MTVDDALQGTIAQDVAGVVGDFVLKRGDGIYAYQLACVVDDLEMGITEVVRGADLLGSAPRQVLLAELLGGTPSGFAHVPPVVSADGSRLAKRARGVSLRDHRETGVAPAKVIAALARVVDLPPRDTPRDLLRDFDRERLTGVREVRIAGETVDFGV